MLGNYVLDENGQPRLEPDWEKFCAWYSTTDLQVAFTVTGNVAISTVFLARDHSLSFGPGPEAERIPVLWETMVFGSVLDEEKVRYTSRDDAVTGHAVMVAEVERALRERYEERKKR